MKKVFIGITALFVFSCVEPREYKINLNGKWVLLESEFQGEELRDDLNHTSLLAYEIKEFRVYPAIRFNATDSTVIVPGRNDQSEKLRYSIDRDHKKIQFNFQTTARAHPEIENSTFIDSFYVQEFDVTWDEKLGRMTLRSDNTNIYMLPAKQFSMEIKRSKLD